MEHPDLPNGHSHTAMVDWTEEALGFQFPHSFMLHRAGISHHEAQKWFAYTLWLHKQKQLKKLLMGKPNGNT